MSGENFLDYSWFAVVIGSKASLNTLETSILLTGGENHLFLKLSLTRCFVVNTVLSFGGENIGMKL